MSLFTRVGKIGILTLGLTFFVGAIGSGKAGAATLDVTAQGSTGTINSAIFTQVSNGVPAGTGVIDAFLGIQRRGNNTTEQGYNTDGTLEFDTLGGAHTNSLLLTDVPIINIGGTDYRQFILDVNEPNEPNREDLTLDMLQIFLGNAPNLTGYPTFGGNATQIYDLDSNGNNSVLMEDRNSGSGRYDYLIYIPDSAFATSNNPYVYLFAKFTDVQGGFEEFAVGTPTNGGGGGTKVPEPASLAGLGLIGAAIAFSRRRKTGSA